MPHAFATTLQSFKTASGKEGRFWSLPALAKQYPNVARLPVSIRVVLESVLRNCDGKKVLPEHVVELAGWKPTAPRLDEVPFVVPRRPSGLHRRAAACRPGGDAQRCR
jgi:aconitate hydratase